MFNNIVIFIGIFCSFGLVFSVFRIKYLSKKVRGFVSSENSGGKTEGILVQGISKHFESAIVVRGIISHTETQQIIMYFEKALGEKIKNERKIRIIFKNEELFNESFTKVHFGPTVVSRLQKQNNKELVKQSVDIYFVVIKLIFLAYYIKKKENQLEIEAREHSYKINSFNLKVTESEKGLEGISIE